mmetsp:Transcript_88783/g.246619  ORF Transcript_88783/g.246619 Transcript_88783/m.246619 type:complete len:317 (-) Transcript_88783:154-1104(-)
MGPDAESSGGASGSASGSAQAVLEGLPPLPKPQLRRMRMEALGGCTLVVSIVAGCLGATQIGNSYLVGWLSREVIWASNAVVYVAALVAMICLFGLMWGDPGVLRRSKETCLPLPEEVAERLGGGQPLQPMENILIEGRTYCSRCLLWRVPSLPEGQSTTELCECFGTPKDNRIHHCSTCQRCVEHFDHHCGVFGRCIAGRGFGGNMGYFKVIICTGQVGCLWAAVTLCLGLARSGEFGYWFAVLVGSYAGLVCVSWCGIVCMWQIRRISRRMPFWDLSRLCTRSAGWTRFEPHGAGLGSDNEVSPVNAVVIGAHR